MAGRGRENADSALVVALAGGAKVADAAKQAGVSERTVFRRLQDAEFQQQLTTARARLVDEATGKLSQIATKAVETLEQLLRAKSEYVRLGAARAVLELGQQYREADLERRVEELERSILGEEQRWRA